MLPDAKEDLLPDVLGLGRIAEHPTGKSNHFGEVTPHELGGRALVARANSVNQFLVRITHGVSAKSHWRCAATDGRLTKIEPLTTLCILPQHLPSVSCSLAEPVRATRV
jgi:hypothetical protein